jgi:hypothetical protein
MSLTVTQSTQFTIEELILILPSNQKYDLTGVFTEINLFDNLFTPCVSANILLTDANNLSNKLKLKGQEKIKITISKANDRMLRFEKEFVIYSLTNKKSINLTSSSYVLNLVSEEFVFSEQQKLSQNFTGLYSEAVTRILNNYLRVPNSSPANGRSGVGVIYPTTTVQDFILPTITPFESLNWISKRALWKNPKGAEYSPDFLFYETAQQGYNFVPLLFLMDLDPAFQINVKPKNIDENVAEEFLGARDMKVLSQFSLLDSVRDGAYAGKFIGFDTLTRTQKITTVKNVYESTVTNKRQYSPNLALNAKSKDRKDFTQMTDSRIVSYPFALPRTTVEYIKENDPEATSLIDNAELYVFQRKAIFSNLLQRRLQLAMPGNFGLFSGRMINLNVPKFSYNDGSKETLDKTLSGKYIITGTRHVIRYDKHETFIEVCTDKIEN